MENKYKKQEIEEEEEEEEEEEDTNDVIYQFMKKIERRKESFYITTTAFNVMCGTNSNNNGLMRINPLIFWAYSELQLVWRDVMEKLKNKKYKEKNVDFVFF